MYFLILSHHPQSRGTTAFWYTATTVWVYNVLGKLRVTGYSRVNKSSNHSTSLVISNLLCTQSELKNKSLERNPKGGWNGFGWKCSEWFKARIMMMTWKIVFGGELSSMRGLITYNKTFVLLLKKCKEFLYRQVDCEKRSNAICMVLTWNVHYWNLYRLDTH